MTPLSSERDLRADVEIRTDEEKGDVDLVVKVKEKGRQQISFNGGISGIGGSFFGLEYSTNNLAGRGEILGRRSGARVGRVDPGRPAAGAIPDAVAQATVGR